MRGKWAIRRIRGTWKGWVLWTPKDEAICFIYDHWRYTRKETMKIFFTIIKLRTTI